MEIKIDKIIYEGWGMGTDPKTGRKIFVKKTAPDDIVECETLKEKSTFTEAKVKKVIKNSPIRIAPKCPYFEKCGGCDHQNISYENQLKIKNEIFKETLIRAKINLIPDEIIPGSDQHYYYRNVIRFLIKTDNENKLQFYMRNFDYKDELVRIDSCLLLSEESNKIIEAFKNFIDKNVDNKEKLWQFRIRHAKETDQYMIEIFSSGSTLPEELGIVHALLRCSNKIVSIYHLEAKENSQEIKKRRLIFGSSTILEKVGYFKFQISPDSFFQTNSSAVKNLYDQIKKMAGLKFGEKILDLYCGTGTIGIYLSTMAKEVVGVEIVKAAVKDAIDNAKLNHIKNCSFFALDANEFLRNTNQSFDLIVVDPPRAGLSKDLIARLGRTSFKRIIYVSCNPATFTRDINYFSDHGIQLKAVRPIDMFPQTHHIECIGVLEGNC